MKKTGIVSLSLSLALGIAMSPKALAQIQNAAVLNAPIE